MFAYTVFVTTIYFKTSFKEYYNIFKIHILLRFKSFYLLIYHYIIKLLSLALIVVKVLYNSSNIKVALIGTIST